MTTKISTVLSRLGSVCAFLTLAQGLSLMAARPAHAAVGDLLKTVTVPAAAQCPGIGTSVTLVPGPMIDRNEPILLVTSCFNDNGQEKNLYFLDPSTEPATLVHTIVTNPTPPLGWGSLAIRGDKGDITGCGNSADETHAIYAIDINPRNNIPDGTATFLFNGQSGTTICDGHTWDTSDNTFYMSPDVSFTIYHFSETGALLGTFPSPPGCPNSGVSVAGASLFVACNGVLTVHQVNKTNGNVFTTFAVPGQRTEDLEADPISFASVNKDAMWSKDAFTNQIFAFEIPPGTAGFAGGSPVAPARCTGGLIDNTDTDGDGLLDCWETAGIDFDGDGVIDFTLPGADPMHKDIYVEVDYMELHQPNPTAMNAVITAFANAPVDNPDNNRGIRLHIQVDEQAVTHNDLLALTPRTPPAGPTDVDFDLIKLAKFGTAAERAHPNSLKLLNAKRFAYHYALFAHGLKGLGGSSGVAELGANDFVVTLGSSSLHAIVNGHRVGDADEQAVTFMHELGHNLFLRHGGGDRTNCKPNYLSVMSYSRQFRYWVSNRPLDYSDTALPTLNENAQLAEQAGIGGTAGDVTAFGPAPTLNDVNASGAINWNRDGDSTDTGLSVDLNDFGIGDCEASPGQTLVGYNDWANLQYNFRASVDFADGVHLTVDTAPELNGDEVTQAFQTFDVAAELKRGTKEFKLNGEFDLGATSNGIAPTVENVTLTIGSYGTTILAGSFSHQSNKFTFKGKVDGVTIDFEMVEKEEGLVDFKVDGKGGDIAGIVNPVTVTLTIGDDTASATINADIKS